MRVATIPSPWGEPVVAWRIEVENQDGQGFPFTKDRSEHFEAVREVFRVDGCGRGLAIDHEWWGLWYDDPWRHVYPPLFGTAPVLPERIDGTFARNLTWSVLGEGSVPERIVLRTPFDIQAEYALIAFENGNGRTATDLGCAQAAPPPPAPLLLLDAYDIPVQPTLQDALAAFRSSPQASNRDTWFANHDGAVLAAVRFDPAVESAYTPPIVWEGGPQGAWTLMFADDVQSLLVTCYWEPTLAVVPDGAAIQCSDEVASGGQPHVEVRERNLAAFEQVQAIATRVRDVSECAFTVMMWLEPAEVGWCNDASLAGKPTLEGAAFLQRMDTGTLSRFEPGPGA